MCLIVNSKESSPGHNLTFKSLIYKVFYFMCVKYVSLVTPMFGFNDSKMTHEMTHKNSGIQSSTEALIHSFLAQFSIVFRSQLTHVMSGFQCFMTAIYSFQILRPHKHFIIFYRLCPLSFTRQVVLKLSVT